MIPETFLYLHRKQSAKIHMNNVKITTSSSTNAAELNRTDHIKAFIKTLYDAKPIPKDQENLMFMEYMLTKDKKIKDRIIKSNMRFVFSAAKAFTNDPEMILDLTMEGTIGLIEAFDRFDPGTNNSFLSFANHYVYKYMVEYIHDSERIRRSKDHSLKSKASRIRERYFAENGRYPSDDEVISMIQDKYGIDVKKEDYVREITVSSLDEVYTYINGDEVSAIDSPEFTSRSEFVNTNGFVLKEENESNENMISACLSMLSERNREIMKKLFGIGYYREYTPEEVADEYGMTLARINQIKNESIEKIRKNAYSIAV